MRREPKVPTPVAAQKVDLAHPGVALLSGGRRDTKQGVRVRFGGDGSDPI